jgi:hypothetical protein
MNWKLNEKEKKIVFWGMLGMMLLYLAYSLVILSQNGAMEYCVDYNETITCFKTELEAEDYSYSVSYPKNLDYNYINNYTNIVVWDK